ncbi:MAG: SCP2 sterol-binding domain-containing protein [Candidatus Bathyarchaeota archaeon]|nr:SCP2 sterol-binding domain-containing protein [Candidatus Bathyarchaeota archaeon]MDH5787473.1 SCP2 sterol-binding domain-containing protein [Candidatus Bathyarchaeota archaeon]
MEKYEVRNFMKGDEEEIVKFSNATYERFGGYVPRTTEYWRWCCLKRPDVKEDGIFLIFSKETGNLTGYIVVGSSGNIWEFCSKSGTENVAKILLESAVKYLEEIGASSVNVNVPYDDEALNGACKQLGFAKANAHKMFVGVLSFKKLISMLVAVGSMESIRKISEEIIIKVKDAPFWIENAVSFEVHNGEVRVHDGLSFSPTILVQTDLATLTSVLFGTTSPHRAILTRKVKVKPFWKITTMIKLLLSMRVTYSWFWPLGDFG